MVAGAGGREAQDPLTETRGAAPALNAWLAWLFEAPQVSSQP
jgi:hypothetical protein